MSFLITLFDTKFAFLRRSLIPAGGLCVVAFAALTLRPDPPQDAPLFTQDQMVVENRQSILSLPIPQHTKTAVQWQVQSGPPCVGQIENGLRAIHAQLDHQTETPWAAMKPQITTLMQNAIDCPDAGFAVVGDLNLIETGWAHLRIRWDQDNRTLTFKAAAESGPANDAPTIAPLKAGWMDMTIH